MEVSMQLIEQRLVFLCVVLPDVATPLSQFVGDFPMRLRPQEANLDVWLSSAEQPNQPG